MSSPQPIPGVTIRPPLRPPGPGEVVVGYELYSPETGCCKCDGMTSGGLASVIILVLFFWPAAFIPCCMDECFEKQQRPIYGPPGSGPPQGYAPPPPPAYSAQPSPAAHKGAEAIPGQGPYGQVPEGKANQYV